MRRIVDAALVRDLIHGDYEGDDWEVVQEEMDGTWRWGTEHTIILRCASMGPDEEPTLWGLHYRVQTSNEDYMLMFMEEGTEVELWKAVAVPVHTTEYREER